MATEDECFFCKDACEHPDACTASELAKLREANTQLVSYIDDLRAENERLRAALREIERTGPSVGVIAIARAALKQD